MGTASSRARRRGPLRRSISLLVAPRPSLGDEIVFTDPPIALGDVLEEVQELLLPVPRVAGVGDLSGRDFERGEQRGDAMSHLVVGGLSYGSVENSLGPLPAAVAEEPRLTRCPVPGRASVPPRGTTQTAPATHTGSSSIRRAASGARRSRFPSGQPSTPAGTPTFIRFPVPGPPSRHRGVLGPNSPPAAPGRAACPVRTNTEGMRSGRAGRQAAAATLAPRRVVHLALFGLTAGRDEVQNVRRRRLTLLSAAGAVRGGAATPGAVPRITA